MQFLHQKPNLVNRLLAEWGPISGSGAEEYQQLDESNLVPPRLLKVANLNAITDWHRTLRSPHAGVQDTPDKSRGKNINSRRPVNFWKPCPFVTPVLLTHLPQGKSIQSKCSSLTKAGIRKSRGALSIKHLGHRVLPLTYQPSGSLLRSLGLFHQLNKKVRWNDI